MWTTLVNHLDIGKNENGVKLLKLQFSAEKLQDGESMEVYIARVTNYKAQLAYTRQPLSDDDIIS